MANENVTPEQLGGIFAQFAPDLPPEVAGAFLKQESDFSTNSRSWSPNASGNQGPGQLGVPEFKTFFPAGELGRQGNPNNMQDSAIAAARMIQDRWKKSEGDLFQLSRSYYGTGTAKDKSNAMDYAHSLIAQMNTLENNPLYNKFIAGNAYTTERNQIKGKRDQFSTMMAGLPINEYVAAGNTVAIGVGANRDLRLGLKTADQVAQETAAKGRAGLQPLFKPGEKEAIVTSTQFDLDQVIGAVKKETNAALALHQAKFQGAEQESLGAKQAASLFGFDMGNAASVVEVAGAKMKQNMLALMAGQEELHRKQTTNPIFAVLDGLSGGMLTKPATEEFARLQAENTQISKGMAEMEARASNVMAIGKATVNRMTAAEADAQREVLIANGEKQIATLKQNGNLKIQTLEQKLEDLGRKAENSQRAGELKQAGYELKVAQDAWKKDIEDRKLIGKGLVDDATIEQKKARTLQIESETKTKQAKAQAYLDEDDNVNKWGKKLGMDRASLDALIKKDKGLVSIVTSSADNPPLSALQYLNSKNQLTGQAKLDYDKAYGGAGYAKAALLSPLEIAGLKTAKAIEDASKAKVDVFNAAQTDIYNPAGLSEAKRNPYAAVFGQIKAAANPQSAIGQSVPEAKAFTQTPLFAELTKKYSGNSSDRQSIGDENVLEVAKGLVKTQGLDAAAMQVSLYYTAAVKVNNFTNKYSKVGLQDQVGYSVTAGTAGLLDQFAGQLASSSSRLDSFLGKATPGAFAENTLQRRAEGVTSQYAVDLTSPQEVKRLLLSQYLREQMEPSGATQ